MRRIVNDNLDPGSKLQFNSHSLKPVKVVIEFNDGTSFETILGIGQTIDYTVGNQLSPKVSLYDVDVEHDNKTTVETGSN